MPQEQKIDRRYFSVPVSVRAEGEGDEQSRVIEGYAARFNDTTDLGYFTEEIAEGAFDDALGDDVRCLFNHDPNYPLARSVEGKGTLRLSVDNEGLHFSFDVGDQTYARDLLESVERGDVNQASFAFTIEEETWTYREDDDQYHRTINKIGRLYDVAPVTYPAYPTTSIAARCKEALERIPAEVRDLKEKPTPETFDASHWRVAKAKAANYQK